MRPMRRRLTIVLMAALAVGCATRRDASSTASSLRAADNPPERFVTEGPTSGTACHNPMIDPRDGARLRLIWSADGQGEYEVPAGRYGVGDGEVLRLDCATGRVLGIATRRKES